MSTAKINIKNIDYFKYRKLVVDGCRDDYAACSREVRALCDAVQTLSFRDDEFDDPTDRSRLADIGLYYRQILAAKRVDPVDMRLKSGWWGDPNRTVTGYSAGKIKQTMLLDVLASKTRDWISRHNGASSSSSSVSGGGLAASVEPIEEKLEGPGLYVFKHRERQCFQMVGLAATDGGNGGVFARCAERLKAAFDGAPSSGSDQLAALLVISLASDWDFYFVPVAPSDGQRLLRILENDLILKHDTIWPHGLNNTLHIDTPVEVSEFRRSCLRHRWPPEYDTAARPETELDLDRLRKQINVAPPGDLTSSPSSSSLHSSMASTPVGSAPTSNASLRHGDSTSRGSHHHDDANNDRPVTPSKKQASSSRSSATGHAAPSKAAAGPGSDQQQSSTSKSASTKTTHTGAHRPNTVAKETSAGATGVDAASTGKSAAVSTSSKSPTKRSNEKQVASVASSDSSSTTKTNSGGKTSHEAAETTEEDTSQPLKRSGTFTSVPAAVDAEEECKSSAAVCAPVRTSSRLPVTSTGTCLQQT